ncbi:MAG: tetratricopeptide repeat protein [Gammaproteobacteria bacterium]|nr:tetratricopeptide repeat protein [Gammaproteobacteria bacterium]
MILSACGTTEERLDAAESQVAESSSEEDLPVTPEGTALTKQPGMIKIERHTPGYTISMMLDATDDNVYFVMDLPPEELQKNQEPENSKQTPQNKASQSVQDNGSGGANKHVLYAQTYFFEKKYDRAMNEIDRSLEKDPNNAVAYSLKGSIHYKRGEKSKAVQAWEKSLEIDPNQDNVKKMLNNLK